MEKDKLVLADGTQIELESSQKTAALYVKAENKSVTQAVMQEQIGAANHRMLDLETKE